MEFKLLHGGTAHSISLLRKVDNTWDIELNGEPWAHGRRIKQSEWYVYRGGREQRGRTLERAVTTMFYWIMKEKS